MISLDFALRLSHTLNPKAEQKRFYDLDRKLAPTKNLEIEVFYYSWTDLFTFELDLTWVGRDHAGPRLALTLFGLYACIQVYDSRHWHHDENRWEAYPGEGWDEDGEDGDDEEDTDEPER